MPAQSLTVTETMKELLSDPNNRIKLDDLVNKHINDFLEATGLEHFPMQSSSVSPEDFLARLHAYESAVEDLKQISILLARWGDREQILLLEKIFKRLAEGNRESSGVILWLHMSWYPLLILMYSAGIAALSVRNYPALKVSLDVLVPAENSGHKRLPLVVRAIANISSVNFKAIPGFENNHTPRSDYIAESLRKPIEDLLFLGTEYERIFDEYEILMALAYVHSSAREWGPIGRFAWRYRYDEESSPMQRLLSEAKKADKEWAILQAGLFDGSAEEFFKAYETYKTSRLDRADFF